MRKIKKGDIVGRKSYGKDVIFVVKNIIETRKDKIAILRGLVDRIEADSYIEDLEVIENKVIKDNMKRLDEKVNDRLKQSIGLQKDNNYKIGIVTRK